MAEGVVGRELLEGTSRLAGVRGGADMAVGSQYTIAVERRRKSRRRRDQLA